MRGLDQEKRLAGAARLETAWVLAFWIGLAYVPGETLAQPVTWTQQEEESATPPATRHELLRRARTAKRRQVAPYRPNRGKGAGRR